MCHLLLVSIASIFIIHLRDLSVTGKNLQRRSSSLQEESDSPNIDSIGSQKEKFRGASKRYGQKKYPALFAAVEKAQVGGMSFHEKDGTLYVNPSVEEEPVAIWEAPSDKSTQEPGPSMERSQIEKGIRAKNGYTRQRMNAEREGVLDEFLQRHAERIAKNRQGRSEEEKKHRGRYEYAKRKADLQALRLIDPRAALKVKEERVERRRMYNKTYNEKKRMEREQERSMREEFEKASTTPSEGDAMTVRDFDLNHLYDDQRESTDVERSAQYCQVIDLNQPAQVYDDEDWSLRRRASQEGETTSERATTPDPSVSTQSSIKVKHPALYTISKEIPITPPGPGHARESNAQFRYDVTSGKVQVKLRHGPRIIELDPVPIPLASQEDERQSCTSKPTYYHRKLQEVKDKGPEAYEAYRQKLRDQNRRSYQRMTVDAPRDQSEYFRYASLLRKQKMAILKETEPEEYERKLAEKKERQRAALRRYREKVKKGLPIKKYRGRQSLESIEDNCTPAEQAECEREEVLQGVTLDTDGEGIQGLHLEVGGTIAADFDLNVSAFEEEVYFN